MLTVFLGLVYPLAITGISQVVFPGKANGSQGQGRRQGRRLEPDRPVEPCRQDGKPARLSFQPSSRALGDRLLAATSPSSATPARTASKRAKKSAKTSHAYLQLRASPSTTSLTSDDVPVDAVTQSASGVDPHISEANARIQAHRVAAVRQPAARPGRRPDLRQHRRPLPRRARRARRQRPRAQHRPRQGSAASNDHRDPGPLPLRPRDPAPGAARVAAQARPPRPGPQPGHVRGRDRRRDHHRRLADPGLRRQPARRRPRALLVHLQRHRLALADGRLRQPRRGAGRGPRPRPGGEPAGDAHRDRPRSCATAARSRPPSWSAATSSWSRPARRSPATAP